MSEVFVTGTMLVPHSISSTEVRSHKPRPCSSALSSWSSEVSSISRDFAWVTHFTVCFCFCDLVCGLNDDLSWPLKDHAEVWRKQTTQWSVSAKFLLISFLIFEWRPICRPIGKTSVSAEIQGMAIFSWFNGSWREWRMAWNGWSWMVCRMDWVHIILNIPSLTANFTWSVSKEAANFYTCPGVYQWSHLKLDQNLASVRSHQVICKLLYGESLDVTEPNDFSKNR